jgi:hypothetical protein
MHWLVLLVACAGFEARGTSDALASGVAACQSLQANAVREGGIVQTVYQEMVSLLFRPPFSLFVTVEHHYSADPNARMEQLLFDSEDLRKIHDEYRRFWMKDEPSHMTYERVHGGIGP